MIKKASEHLEKRAQYAELVYDLIFVYIIGRNNALLHHTVGGYVSLEAFVVYIACTLAVIQIWNYTTYYINAYGRNSARDNVLLFTNMFLMFFLARGTQSDWQNYHMMYHIAWVLILLNIAAHYLIEARSHIGDPVHSKRIRDTVLILSAQAIAVGLAIGEFQWWGTTFMSLAAILFGMIAPLIARKDSAVQIIDFEYLSERVMLYIVLTFGEMIIAIAGYFEGDITVRSLYFAFMAFMIVVALFLSYGVFYDRIIDKKMQTDGMGYMLIHVFLIFALNNITSSLEFMRDDEVDLLQKITFMTASLLIYFLFLFATGHYVGKHRKPRRSLYIAAGLLWLAFAAAMFLLREYMAANIAATVIFVFGVYLIIRLSIRKAEES